MKYLIASDIHGDVNAVKSIVKKFKEHKCDKIILLGDYLSFNKDDNEAIIAIFELFKNDLILIRGNCDYYLNDETFGIELRDSFSFRLKDRVYLFTHGDYLTRYINLLLNVDNAYIIHGHTHRVSSYISGGISFINIGSISLPRGGSKKCYAILDENGVKIFDLDDHLILEK